MAEGTKNEVPTLSALRKYEFVSNLFEVELLEMIDYPYLEVSPDDVVTFTTRKMALKYWFLLK